MRAKNLREARRKTSKLRISLAGDRDPASLVAEAVDRAWAHAARAQAKPSKREVVVPEPSYAIPGTLLAIAGLSAYEGATPLAALTGVLGAFLTIQASRVKFVFDNEALVRPPTVQSISRSEFMQEVVIGDQNAESENAFVGGKNRWAYSSFTNWEFWWPGFPVLVYFKETQTKPDGQIHFFPIIFNGKQLYDVMLERCGSTQTSGPK